VTVQRTLIWLRTESKWHTTAFASRGRKKLREWLDGEAKQAATVSREVRNGKPFVEIARYAKENDSDLIMIGTHGRGALSHVLTCSVAAKVV